MLVIATTRRKVPAQCHIHARRWRPAPSTVPSRRLGGRASTKPEKEAKDMAKMLMSKKAKRLYGRMQHGRERKQAAVARLREAENNVGRAFEAQ